jgi:hypothetical protein
MVVETNTCSERPFHAFYGPSRIGRYQNNPPLILTVFQMNPIHTLTSILQEPFNKIIVMYVGSGDKAP